jgi:DNA-binding transcriptional regulator YdaS (Cro superfamily)
MVETVKERGIDRAVAAAGTQRKLAAQLGVTQQAINNMQRRGYCSLARAIEIEALFGIPREELLSPRLADLLAPTLGE